MKIRFNQPEKKSPDDDRGMRVQYGHTKRLGKPWRWYMILIIVSLPLLYLLGLLVREMIVIEASGQVNVPLVTVRSSGEGYIQQVLVEPLQIVTKGSKLALLENVLLDNNYDRVRNELSLLDKDRDRLLLQVDNAVAKSIQLIDFAREQRDFHLNRLRQYELLFKQKAATQAEIATARSQYLSALENYASIESTQYLRQPMLPEIRQITARINQLTLELDKTQDEQQQLMLVAPAEGLITELFAQPGEYLSRGQPLLEIIFPEEAHINAFIPPKYQNYAVVNQTATIKFPNGEVATARITSVPGVTRKSSAENLGPLETPRSTILAKMVLTDTVKTQLIHGMPVSIHFPFFAN